MSFNGFSVPHGTRGAFKFLTFNQDRCLPDLGTHWHVSQTSSFPVVHTADGTSTEPEGCIIPFVFDNRTGWVGFFILNRSVRGRGWGAAIFKAGLDEFKKHDCQYVGLDAVLEQVNTYRRRGFVSVGYIRVMVREALGKMPLPSAEDASSHAWTLQDLRTIEPEKLVAFEEQVTGFRRSRLWSHEGMWHRDKNEAFGFAALTASSDIQGFVLTRSCESGYRVGPLYALSKEVASSLLLAAMKRVGELTKDAAFGAELYVANKESQELFESFGWTPAGVDYHRMWIDGKAPPPQSPGGVAQQSLWACFDAGQG